MKHFLNTLALTFISFSGIRDNWPVDNWLVDNWLVDNWPVTFWGVGQLAGDFLKVVLILFYEEEILLKIVLILF